MDDESELLGGNHGESIHVDESEAAALLLSDDEDNERRTVAEDDDTLVLGLNQADLFEDSFMQEGANFTHLKTRSDMVKPTSFLNLGAAGGIVSKRNVPSFSSSRSNAIGLEAALSNRSKPVYPSSACPFPNPNSGRGLFSGGRNRRPGDVPHRRERTHMQMENPSVPDRASSSSGRHSLPVRSVPQHCRPQPFGSRPRLSAENVRIAETEQRIAVDPLAPPRKDLKPYQPFHENDEDEIEIVSESINSPYTQYAAKSEFDHDTRIRQSLVQETSFASEAAIKEESCPNDYKYNHVTEDEVMVIEDNQSNKEECVDVSEDEEPGEEKPVGFYQDFGKGEIVLWK
jgi:hypothetical protein